MQRLSLIYAPFCMHWDTQPERTLYTVHCSHVPYARYTIFRYRRHRFNIESHFATLFDVHISALRCVVRKQGSACYATHSIWIFDSAFVRVLQKKKKSGRSDGVKRSESERERQKEWESEIQHSGLALYIWFDPFIVLWKCGWAISYQ